MSTFSKINSFFLAVVVVFTTIGHVQTSPESGRIFAQSEKAETPAYSGISTQVIWGVINLDSSSSINFFSNSDSEENLKSSSKTATARESALAKISSLYLVFTRDIDVSPTIGELLYPFHFYF